MKEKLKEWLIREGLEVDDFGTFTYDKDDDYPDFAYQAALKVAEKSENRGIFLCGSGTGMDIVANKVKGIRATLAYSVESAKHSRSHDDVNVITLSGDALSFEEARDIVKAWLETAFSGEERHMRRLGKIKEIEDRHFKS